MNIHREKPDTEEKRKEKNKVTHASISPAGPAPTTQTSKTVWPLTCGKGWFSSAIVNVGRAKMPLGGAGIWVTAGIAGSQSLALSLYVLCCSSLPSSLGPVIWFYPHRFMQVEVHGRLIPTAADSSARFGTRWI